MQAFEYIPATTVNEAIAILHQQGDQARLISGGTDLIVQLREGRRKPKIVVDIKRIPEVNQLSYNLIDGLTIGAAVPCYKLYGSAVIKETYPGLIDAASLIGGVQIQGRATLGGNLCNASPAADSIPALIAHNAIAVVAGMNGERHIPVQDFCTSPGRTQLEPDEMLVSIQVPAPRAHSYGAYLRFTPRNEMDIAVVGVGVWVALDDTRVVITAARIALGAVGPTPLFVNEAGASLVGQPIGSQAIEKAALIAQLAAKPITDMRGSAEQRRHLVAVLTRRALDSAIARASA